MTTNALPSVGGQGFPRAKAGNETALIFGRRWITGLRAKLRQQRKSVEVILRVKPGERKWYHFIATAVPKITCSYIEGSIISDDERYEAFQEQDSALSSAFTFTSVSPNPQTPLPTPWPHHTYTAGPSPPSHSSTMSQPTQRSFSGGMSMQSMVHGFVTSQRSEWCWDDLSIP